MRRLLTLVAGLSLCLLLTSMAAISQAGPADTQGKGITEQKIQAMIKSTERAIRNRDARGVGAVLADDAIVTIKNMPGPDGPQTLSFTKKQYVSFLQASWEVVKGHTYERRDVQIDIAGSGDIATVTDRVLETTTTVDGAEIKSAIDEESILELRDGRILVISVEGVVSRLDVTGGKAAGYPWAPDPQT